VHELIVPPARAGLQVDRDEALAEQVVARTRTAVVVVRRQLDGQVGESQLLVH
jgi:hypothetical protein